MALGCFWLLYESGITQNVGDVCPKLGWPLYDCEPEQAAHELEGLFKEKPNEIFNNAKDLIR